MLMVNWWKWLQHIRLKRLRTAREIGTWGERIAAGQLRAMGYSLIAKNAVISGVEIDIVCYDYSSHEVVLVEVKTTCSKNSSVRVRASQQRRISRACRAVRSTWNVRAERIEIRINPEDSD